MDEFLFFGCLSLFCFLLIEFHCIFSISYKIQKNYVYYYCILTRIAQAVGPFFSFMPALLLSILTPLFLSSSSVYVTSFLLFLSASVWGAISLVHEYHISDSHTEWYLFFFRQCNYKCTMCIRSKKLEIVKH